MRKRIGLIIGEQDSDYCKELVKVVTREAHKNDFDVFIFANYGTYDHSVYLYGEGEISVYKIPDLDSFDGFILDETLYNIENMGEIVYSYFDKNATCPVISLKKRTNRFYDILVEDRQGIKSMTEHFIKKHGFTKICHMTGRWELQDARERYHGYEDAMMEADLDITNDMVFYGDYWKNKGAEAVEYFSKNGYPEAIVCANDYMAISVCTELAKRGIKVPEDICVSGFDDSEEGRCQNIPLTTVEDDIESFALCAIRTLEKAIAGEDVVKEQYIPNKLQLRDSCGCAHCDNSGYTEFRLSNMTRHYYGIDMSTYMYNGYQSTFDIDGIFTNADRYYKYNFSEKCYICLCDDALTAAKRPVELINEYSNDMVLKRIFYRESDRNYDSPEITFARKHILPPEILNTDKPGKYYVNPIHSQNKCYGYMVSIYDEDEYPYHFTQSYTAALGNAIDSYNINIEFMNMESIKNMYLTDPLTSINNRRGFEQDMILILDRAKRHPLYISVVSIDMDDLKSINDTYGHNAGDECLMALGRALTSSITSGETIARFGGDEFSAVLASPNADRHLHFEKDLLNAIDLENAKMDAPYKLHASIGLIHVGSSPKTSLFQYMQSADQLMYKHKEEYKKNLKREIR